MPKFTFRKSDHTYWIGGERLPSVTGIISPLNDFSMIRPAILERAGQLGTHVHEMVKLHLDNILDIESLDDNLGGYLAAFKKWQADYDIYSFDEIETPAYHNKLLYAGTPDLVIRDIVIDIKTRRHNPLTDPLQLAGYKNLYNPCKKEGYILELKPDRTYHYQKVGHYQAWPVFRVLLDNYKSNRNTKKIIEKWKTCK